MAATSGRRSPATAASAERGFPVAGIVDVDESKIGSVIAGVRVRRLDELPAILRASKASIGVIATPGSAAQEAADRLVKAGVTSILNFAPIVLTVPPGIMVRKVDLAVELQILSYYEQRRTNGASAAVATSLQAVSAGPRRGATA